MSRGNKYPNENAKEGEQNWYKESWGNPVYNFHPTKHNKAQQDGHDNAIDLEIVQAGGCYRGRASCR